MKLLFSSLVLAMVLLAQSPQSALKSTPGFDIGALDREVSPCTNFYQYACGTWMRNNPVPADQASWGRFDELNERNEMVLRDILEKVSSSDPKRTPIEQKIGDFYAACMDEPGIERQGTEPLKAELARIAAINNRTALTDEVARFHLDSVNVLF